MLGLSSPEVCRRMIALALGVAEKTHARASPFDEGTFGLGKLRLIPSDGEGS
jgi:hypothetical protein